MRREVLAGVGASWLALLARADAISGRVDFEDNVAGASAAEVTSSGNVTQIRVAELAANCRLQAFLMWPAQTQPASPEYTRVRTADEIRDGKAIVRVSSPGDWIVRAQYVHTVVVDQGTKTEPEDDPRASGEGDLQIGRPLSGGYRFDHVEFSSTVLGPGGASARIRSSATPGAADATATIRWYFDAYSKVQFQWKVFARGPCDAAP